MPVGQGRCVEGHTTTRPCDSYDACLGHISVYDASVDGITATNALFCIVYDQVKDCIY